MEKFQTPPAQTPPKFVFGAGSSSSSFEFGPPPGNASVYHHPKYYMDTDMVVFRVHDKIEGIAGVANLAAI